MSRRTIGNKVAVLAGTLVVMTACNKDIVTGVDPYAGGKEALGIGFYVNYPDPGTARPGELVDFRVKGLKGKLDKINFFVNNTPVEVVTAQDSLVTIKVPQQISSGDAKIVVGEEVFYGPRLDIEGNTKLDENYGMVHGFRGSIDDIFPHAGGYIVAGPFFNFEQEAVPNTTYRDGIHFIDGNGKTSSTMNFGQGTFGGSGFVSSIAKAKDGNFMLAGSMYKFNKRAIQNIVRVNSKGEVDEMVVEVINQTNDPKNSLDTVCTFNGGTNGMILKTFTTTDNKVIAVGNFRNHYKIDYKYSSRDSRKYIISNAQGVIRMKADGSLDSTFALNNAGANGLIMSAEMIDNDRIVIVGEFTTYNGKPANHIACINADGTVDETFKPNATAGRLTRVTYNSELKKLAVSGTFTGAGSSGKVNKVALINTNGSVDEEFKLGDIGSGLINFAYVLNNGRVVVSGSQTSYNGVQRPGMLILEKDGQLLQKYNSEAPFTGMIAKVVETRSSLGEPALLIGGYISQYGRKAVGNFLRVEIKE